MARKSRRSRNENTLPAAAKEVPVTAQMPAAAYARLSVENSGYETEDSILTQITLVQEFITSHPDLYLADTYVDNGYTGSNFDRPEFERMIRDAYSGKIRCIVVKDLSRFGRNYLEMGHYMESIFPRLNVRFIAVTDNFDNSRKEDMESLAVPIKNMINGLYARDISRKIVALNEMKRSRGVPTGSRPPYGYVYTPERDRMVPDPMTAPYVRAMYGWMRNGVSAAEIVRRLKLLGVPAPGERMIDGKKQRPGRKTHFEWCVTRLMTILREPANAGDLPSGKTRAAAYKGMDKVAVPREEWLIKEDAHEALVPRPDFDAVQEILEAGKKKCQEKIDAGADVRAAAPDHFKKLFYCGCCHLEMSVIRTKRQDEDVPHIVYNCRSKKGTCPNASVTINEKTLMVLVMDQIRALLKCALDYEKLAREMLRDTDGSGSKISVRKKLDSLSYRIGEADRRIEKTYDDFADGLLTQEEYQSLKERCILQKQELEKQMLEANQTKERFEHRAKAAIEQAEHLKTYADTLEFDETLVRALVERVTLDENKTIRISFKFRDVFSDFMESVEEMKKDE